jgi:hypothetical protein
MNSSSAPAFLRMPGALVRAFEHGDGVAEILFTGGTVKKRAYVIDDVMRIHFFL